MKLGENIYLARAVALVWRSGRKLMIISTLVMILQGIMPVVPIYVVKLIVDAATAGEGFEAILPLIAVAGAAILMTALLQSFAGYVREAQSQVLSDHVQGMIHRKSLELDMAYYEGPEFFDKLHRAQQEAPHRPAQVVDNLTSILRSAISLAGITGILVYTLPWYTVVILAASAVPPALVRLRHSGRLFRWQMRRTPAERHVYYLNWLITGRPNAKEMRLFGLGPLLSERSREWRQKLRSERLALSARRSTGDFIASGFQALVVVALLGYFSYQSIESSSSLGNLVLFFQAIQKGQQVLADLLRGVAQLYETNLFLANAFEFLNMESSMKPAGAEPGTEGGAESAAAAETAAPGTEDGAGFAGPAGTDGPPGAARAGRGFALEHVSFAYPNSERLVLDDVSLSAGPGEVVAVVGDNGAGKTTLIKLLCRFYDPSAGVVRMDGRDLRSLDVEELRGRLAVIFQDHTSYYYSATENIRFGDVRRPLDRERVHEAARRTRADEFLSRLPDGYDTPLGRWLEEGAELSGGQWKKVALARTLYRQAPYLILDEPTAGLDPDSEAHFIDDLRDLAEGRCLIMVSHKIASARRADRIYVMRDGRVIESGSHDELLHADGYYAGLYHTQLRQIQQAPHA